MLCERCNEHQATVHVTRVVNGDKSEFHLCGKCATREQEELGVTLETAFPIHHLLGELLHYQNWLTGRRGASPEGVRCGNCGLTYEEFTRTGLLGCGRCYEAFNTELEPLLQRVHGATRHSGKAPRRQEGALSVQRQVEGLRRELDAAVAAEEFERAAELRDRIRTLERQLGARR